MTTTAVASFSSTGAVARGQVAVAGRAATMGGAVVDRGVEADLGVAGAGAVAVVVAVVVVDAAVAEGVEIENERKLRALTKKVLKIYFENTYNFA